ncbi:uncharacterized protein LOC125944420 [Dermacentor silvarum]|uniref:uncharacterized protein LOC125944420 n=1 Tax=Dermacentor silvarum TaxID=543639 RepID=UPI002100A0F5|nr:uncharacterized protein LOC125944420 [Dermacentor silvarum]
MHAFQQPEPSNIQHPRAFLSSDADQTAAAMNVPAITAADEVKFCTPPLFFAVAGLLVFFLIGSNLFMFINANVGSAAGLEATEEPETVVSTEDEPHIIRRAVNESEAHDHGAVVLMKPPVLTSRATSASASAYIGIAGPRTNPTGRKTGDSLQLLPSRSLVCVLGGRSQEYGPMWLDGLCDVALVPFYALPKGGDTFHNDGDKVTQQVLDKAAKAVKTTYGIHVPLKKVPKVMDDLIRKRVQKKLRNYWINKHIYHYAILDLRIKTDDTTRSGDVVGKAFGVLKKFKSIQENIRHAASKMAAKRQRNAYVILGTHLRMATSKELFKALEHHVGSFPISAFVVRTHITQREALTLSDGCSIAGPAPYKMKNNLQFMGMASTMSYVRNVTWVRRTPLVVSFTLCTRQYRSRKDLRVGAKCRKDATVTTTSSAMCSERPGFYGNQAIDKTQHTAYSWKKPDLVATYDTADTMRWKVCSLEREHRPLNLSVALFDIECDDWRGKCARPSTSHMKGSDRTRSLRAYMRRLSRRGSVNASGECP